MRGEERRSGEEERRGVERRGEERREEEKAERRQGKEDHKTYHFIENPRNFVVNSGEDFLCYYFQNKVDTVVTCLKNFVLLQNICRQCTCERRKERSKHNRCEMNETKRNETKRNETKRN